jgi:hypothetical protein
MDYFIINTANTYNMLFEEVETLCNIHGRSPELYTALDEFIINRTNQ